MPTHIIGVGFQNPKLNYYQIDGDVEIGQGVVVETSLGYELGRVAVIRPYEGRDEGLFDEILRLATFQDEEIYRRNLERSERAIKIVQNLSDQLKLGMAVVSATLSLDSSKILVTYTAEERVDFREMLKILSGQLHCRIELRQIGPRDKARLVGGIGVCGLPLCCSTFLNAFDGISISMAKNQMLSLNIPKLSGQCGKLMCCLKYEDEAYAELKKEFPSVGSRVLYQNKEYHVSGINVISGNVTISDSETTSTVSAADVKLLQAGKQHAHKR